MLAELSPETEAVLLRTKELVPMKLETGAAFWRQHFFQDQHILERTLANPLTGESRKWTRVLGHKQGKCIVRTSARAVASSVHTWKRKPLLPFISPQNYPPLRTAMRGFHYHFLVVSQARQEKYAKHAKAPPVWRSGRPVDFPKQTWKEISAKISSQEAARYLDQNLFLPKPRLEQLALQNLLLQEKMVERVLIEMDLWRLQLMPTRIHVWAT